MRAHHLTLLAMLAGTLALSGCIRVHNTWRTRTWEEVDGEVVRSRPVYPSGYAAYVRARIAMDRDPPDLDEARVHLERAMRNDPKDPHLWTTLSELEAMAGDEQLALGAAEYALQLRPGYPPAVEMVAKLSAAG